MHYALRTTHYAPVSHPNLQHIKHPSVDRVFNIIGHDPQQSPIIQLYGVISGIVGADDRALVCHGVSTHELYAPHRLRIDRVSGRAEPLFDFNPVVERAVEGEDGEMRAVRRFDRAGVFRIGYGPCRYDRYAWNLRVERRIRLPLRVRRDRDGQALPLYPPPPRARRFWRRGCCRGRGSRLARGGVGRGRGGRRCRWGRCRRARRAGRAAGQQADGDDKHGGQRGEVLGRDAGLCHTYVANGWV